MSFESERLQHEAEERRRAEAARKLREKESLDDFNKNISESWKRGQRHPKPMLNNPGSGSTLANVFAAVGGMLIIGMLLQNIFSSPEDASIPNSEETKKSNIPKENSSPESFATAAFRIQTSYVLDKLDGLVDEKEVNAIRNELSSTLTKPSMEKPAYAYKIIDQSGIKIAIARAPVTSDNGLSSFICVSNGREIVDFIWAKSKLEQAGKLYHTFSKKAYTDRIGTVDFLRSLSGVDDCGTAFSILKAKYNYSELGSRFIQPQPPK